MVTECEAPTEYLDPVTERCHSCIRLCHPNHHDDGSCQKFCPDFQMPINYGQKNYSPCYEGFWMALAVVAIVIAIIEFIILCIFCIKYCDILRRKKAGKRQARELSKPLINNFEGSESEKSRQPSTNSKLEKHANSREEFKQINETKADVQTKVRSGDKSQPNATSDKTGVGKKGGTQATSDNTVSKNTGNTDENKRPKGSSTTGNAAVNNTQKGSSSTRKITSNRDLKENPSTKNSTINNYPKGNSITGNRTVNNGPKASTEKASTSAQANQLSSTNPNPPNKANGAIPKVPLTNSSSTSQQAKKKNGIKTERRNQSSTTCGSIKEEPSIFVPAFQQKSSAYDMAGPSVAVGMSLQCQEDLTGTPAVADNVVAAAAAIAPSLVGLVGGIGAIDDAPLSVMHKDDRRRSSGPLSVHRITGPSTAIGSNSGAQAARQMSSARPDTFSVSAAHGTTMASSAPVTPRPLPPPAPPVVLHKDSDGDSAMSLYTSDMGPMSGAQRAPEFVSIADSEEGITAKYSRAVNRLKAQRDKLNGADVLHVTIFDDGLDVYVHPHEEGFEKGYVKQQLMRLCNLQAKEIRVRTEDAPDKKP